MRLIDADALIKKYGDWYVEEGTESGFIGTLKNLLATEPLIQPVATDTNVGNNSEIPNSSDAVSRHAVIDALEKVARFFPYRVPGNRDTYDRYNEAWNDAIGRAEIEIEELPPAQPERGK